MIAFCLLVVLAAVALGIVGSVVHGLLYLLVIGAVVFLLAFVVLGASLRTRHHRPAR